MDAVQKTLIYLALGSNLGDRLENLAAMREALAPDVVVTKASSIYETSPWGLVDQPDFLNQVLQAETELDPQALLRYVKAIEKALGRTPGIRFGPRVADIDIILYGDLLYEGEDLILPHPRFQERAFVLVPLAEISPELPVPGSDLTVSELLQGLAISGVELFQE